VVTQLYDEACGEDRPVLRAAEDVGLRRIRRGIEYSAPHQLPQLQLAGAGMRQHRGGRDVAAGAFLNRTRRFADAAACRMRGHVDRPYGPLCSSVCNRRS